MFLETTMPRPRKKAPSKTKVSEPREEELDELDPEEEEDSEEDFEEDFEEEISEDEEDEEAENEDDEEEEEDFREPRASSREPSESASREPRAASSSPAVVDGRKKVSRRGRPAVDRRPAEVRSPQVSVDTSGWLGTGEATALVKRQARTLQNWRNAGKVRAEIGPDGCWRYNPDDLVEMMDEGDRDNPSTVMAVGMTTIVQQGDRAGQRLLEMTGVTTAGLERTCEILQESLEQAYARIAELEDRLAKAIDRGMANIEASNKHERWMIARKYEHEKEMAEHGDKGTRLASLLSVIGPIGATIAARMAGDEKKAEGIEGGLAAHGSRESVSRLDTSALPFEARLADALSRLDLELRSLDDTTAAAFRLMLPKPVQEALDTLRSASRETQASGQALAVIARAAVDLPKEQFEAVRPVGPAGVVAVLAELRALNEEKE